MTKDATRREVKSSLWMVNVGPAITGTAHGGHDGRSYGGEVSLLKLAAPARHLGWAGGIDIGVNNQRMHIEAETGLAFLGEADYMPWPMLGLSAGAGIARDWSSLAGHWGPQATIAMLLPAWIIVPFYRIAKVDGVTRELVGLTIKVPCRLW